MKTLEETDDPLLRQIGHIGKWQIINFAALSIFCIPVAWQMMVVVFQAPSGIDHWCRRFPSFSNWSVKQWRDYTAPYTLDENGNRKWDSCNIYALDYTFVPEDADNPPPRTTDDTVPCPKVKGIDSRWEFDHSFYQWTIIEDFGLVCQHEYLLQPLQSSFMFGILIGVFLGGICSDKCGRRPTMLSLLVVLVVSSVLLACAETIMLFMMLRFFLALTIMAIYTILFVYCMEIVGGRWRIVLGMMFQVPFSIGFMSVAGMGYIFRDWQHLQLAVSLPITIFFIYYWLVPESPRWLLASKKWHSAVELIENIAEFNGRKYDPDIRMIPVDCDGTKPSLADLLRDRAIRYRTLNIWFSWFANALFYYSLLFAFSEVGDDIYLNTLIGGAVELPAYLLSIGVCLLLGRKVPISALMISAGLSLMATVAIQRGEYERDWPVLALVMFSRFCITASFGIVYVFAAEVFPTVLRTTGVSSASTWGRVGTVLSTFVPSMIGVHKQLPAVFLGSVAMLAGLLILLIPETSGHKLPDTLYEASHLGSGASVDYMTYTDTLQVGTMSPDPEHVEETDTKPSVKFQEKCNDALTKPEIHEEVTDHPREHINSGSVEETTKF